METLDTPTGEGEPTALPQALKRIGSQALDVEAKSSDPQNICRDVQISDSQRSDGKAHGQDWLCHKTEALMSGLSSKPTEMKEG